MLKFWDTKLQSCINPVTVHTSHTLEPVSHKQLQEACRPIKLCSHFDCLKMFSIYVIFMCQDIGLPIPGIHYDDVIMSAIASQTTSLTIVYSIVYSDADQRKHQSSASLAFVWEFTGDRWIPRTNGQLRGKCFHLMTSSWVSMNWSNVSLSMFVVSVTYICTTLAGQHTWQNCTCKCNPISYQTSHVRSNKKITCWSYLRKCKTMFTFSLNTRHWRVTGWKDSHPLKF